MDEMREGLPGPAKEPWHESLNLEEIDNIITTKMKETAENVIIIGYCLRQIDENKLYLQEGYNTVARYAEEKYGMGPAAVSKYIKCNIRFSKNGFSMELDDRYIGFGKSQIQELLSLNSEQLEQVTPDMTVAQIREMRKPKEVPYYPLEGQMEITEFLEPEEPEQPPLPLMRNNDQRKEWLRDYKSWGLWYTDDHIGCRYYKYDFDNGARLIAEVYTQHNEFAGQDYESSYLHLVGGPEPDEHPSGAYGRWSRHERYNRFPNSETELVEFLKSIQKGERK